MMSKALAPAALIPAMHHHILRNDEYIAPTKAKAMQRLMLDLCT